MFTTSLPFSCSACLKPGLLGALVRLTAAAGAALQLQPGCEQGPLLLRGSLPSNRGSLDLEQQDLAQDIGVVTLDLGGSYRGVLVRVLKGGWTCVDAR
jgi:hypothetical protein